MAAPGLSLVVFRPSVRRASVLRLGERLGRVLRGPKVGPTKACTRREPQENRRGALRAARGRCGLRSRNLSPSRGRSLRGFRRGSGPSHRGPRRRRGSPRIHVQEKLCREGLRRDPARPRRAPRPARFASLRLAGRASPPHRPAGVSSAMRKRIALLGATGSIGDSALSVVAHFPDRFEIVSMSAGSNLDKLLPASAAHRPKFVSVKTREDAASLRQEFPGLSVGFGPQGLVDVATIPEADVVLGGIVGSIGLAPAYEAVKLGKTLALANKETLVVAGEPLMAAARASGAVVLPVDSEHCALHQALRAGTPQEVKRLVLTASGGPFRTRDFATFQIGRA